MAKKDSISVQSFVFHKINSAMPCEGLLKDRTPEAWKAPEPRTSFWLLFTAAQILLLAAVTLVLFWVLKFHKFAWREDPANEFYAHPVLMIVGLIFFAGEGMLMYRSLEICVKHRFYIKLAHTICHFLAIPAIVMGLITVLDSHQLRFPPIPDFYSLHSWVGLVTISLFALQFAVGFTSFIVFLCCDTNTAAFRAALVPIHGTMGLVTFLLSIVAAISGLTEKAIFSLGKDYSTILLRPESRAGIEGLVMNSLGAVLIALAIVMPFVLRQRRPQYQLVQVVENQN
ncbi:transmembrane ascorbate-dependent reductase CYB561-like isoform X2 [Artemia franciscana]